MIIYRLGTIIFLLLTLSALIPASVFGQGSIVKEQISLLIQGQPRGEIEVEIDQQTERLRSLNLKPLKLEELFDATVAAKLRQLPSPSPTSDLIMLGIKVEFSYSLLQVDLKLPISLEAIQIVSLNPNTQLVKAPDADEIRPAPFSFLANLRPLYQYGQAERQLVSADVAMRISNIVFLSDLEFEQRPQQINRHRDTRAVIDFPEQSLRTTWGDVRSATSDVITPFSVGGISLTTDFTLIPSGRPLPSPSSELILERRARVNIFTRDGLAQSLILTPGRYRFRDFNFINGISNVRFDVEEEGGRTYSIKVPYAIDERQLAVGRHEISYSSGYEFSDDVKARHYATDRSPISTFIHRYGLDEHATIGAHGQHNGRQSVLGGEWLEVGTYGTLKSELTFSHDPTMAGVRPSLNYLWRKFTDSQITLDYTHESPNFHRVGQRSPSFQHMAGMGFVLRPGQWWSFGIRGSKTWNYQNQQQKLFEINLNGRPAHGYNLTTTLRRQEQTSGHYDTAITFYLTYFFPDQKHILEANAISNNDSHSNEDDQYRLSARGFYNVNSTQIAPQVTSEDGHSSVDKKRVQDLRASVDIRHSRFDLSANHQTSNESIGKDQGQIAGGVALGYTNGQMAFGRPLPGAFAIVNAPGAVVTAPSLAGPVEVGKVPLLVSGLRVYDQQTINLETDEENLGPVSENRLLRTAFFSGHSIDQKKRELRFVTLTLLDKARKPVVLKLGRFQGHDGLVTGEFFTNKQGIAVLEAVPAGPLTLEWENQSTTINIPHDNGMINLGNVYAK